MAEHSLFEPVSPRISPEAGATRFYRREKRRMDNEEYGRRFPRWFHRANWAGGALACLGIGLYPLLAFEITIPVSLWAIFWVFLGAGAANNARLGLNSIHVPARFRKKRPR